MSKPIDRNLLCTRDVEFRATGNDAENGDGRTMEGYAAVFNAPTDINSWEGRFTEQIAPGAFKKTLSERKPVLQFDHGRDTRVGSTPIGKFTDLREDENGLYCEARLFDNPVVEPVRQAIQDQAISGMSFKFAVKRDEWRDKAGKLVKPDELGRLLYEPGDRGPLARTIREVQLFEAGPVVFPAYDQTSVGVRSQADRDALVAEYARTALVEDEIETPSESVETEVEPGNIEEVAREEATQTSVTDAGQQTTSETENTDAARTGTSEEDNQEEETREEIPEATPRKAAPKIMTLEELKARQAEIEARLTAVAEETRDAELTEEQDTEWTALTDERATVTASIAKIEERQSFLKGKAAQPKNVERTTAPNVHIKQDDIYDLGELRALSYSGEDFIARVKDNAKRAVDGAKFGVRGKEDAQAYALELLEEVDNSSADLAKRYLVTGSEDYTRAFGKLLKHGNDSLLSQEERAALTRSQLLGTDASGGFAVPFQLDPTVILTNAGTTNPIRDLARIERIVGKTWQGVTSAGTTVTRGTETTVVGDNSLTLAQPTLNTNRVQGFVPFSIEIDLSWAALQSEITRALVDAKAREEDSFITGDGTGTNPGGVVGSLSGNTVGPFGTAAFAAADVYATQAALDPRWEAGSSWLAHKAIYHKIRQFDTAGGAQLWARIGDGRPNELMAYPAAAASAMDKVLTTGSKILLYGDFSQFLIVDRIGMNVEMVPHLFDGGTGGTNRPTGQRGVYAIWMNNSKILVPSAFKLLVTG